MSDDIQTPEQIDPLKNLKAEMERKLSNSEARLSELQKTNELLFSKLNELTTPKAAPAPQKQVSMSDLLYSNPEEYARIIEERAMERVAAQQQRAQKVNGVISQLAQEFPELSDNNSSLTKRAVEIYNSLPPEEKQSSLSYRLAVKDAADELGLKPKSKRPVDDEPSFGSSGRSAPRRKDKLNPMTEVWATALGLDPSDPKVKARLVERQNRDWHKPKPVK